MGNIRLKEYTRSRYNHITVSMCTLQLNFTCGKVCSKQLAIVKFSSSDFSSKAHFPCFIRVSCTFTAPVQNWTWWVSNSFRLNSGSCEQFVVFYKDLVVVDWRCELETENRCHVAFRLNRFIVQLTNHNDNTAQCEINACIWKRHTYLPCSI